MRQVFNGGNSIYRGEGGRYLYKMMGVQDETLGDIKWKMTRGKMYFKQQTDKSWMEENGVIRYGNIEG